jgi:CPA2 family monovalent cation:H+ antiporter-2
VLVIGGCLALARPLHDMLEGWVGGDLLFRGGTSMLFALAVGLVVLPGLVSVWRNITALSMIAAEAWAGPRRSATVQGLIRRAFVSAAVTLAVLWLAVVAPTDALSIEVLAVLLIVLLVVTLLLWRNLVRWHSSIEIRVHEAIAVASTATGASTAEWKMPDLERDKEWGLQVREVVLPTNSLHAGRRLLDLSLRQATGASIVGIDRQGYAINNPAGSDRLYPDDRLLLLGSEEALGKATAFLAQATERPLWRQHFDELATEHVTVPACSRAAGRTLAQLDLLNTYSVQIGGIRRGGSEVASPSGGEALLEGDRLLVLGDHRNIRRFKESLEPPPASQEEASAEA